MSFAKSIVRVVGVSARQISRVQGLRQAAPRTARYPATEFAAGVRFASSALPARQDVLSFEDGPGDVAAVNWSLCGDFVAPSGSAWYNNTKDEALQKYGGKIGKDAPALKESGADIHPGDFELLFDEVSDFLSNQAEIFAHDGGVSSFRDYHQRVRIITNNPAYALEARKFLVKVSTREVDTARNIVVYIAEGLGSGPASYVSYGNGDQATKIVFVGSPSVSAITDALSTVAAESLAAQNEAVVVPADAYVKGGKVSLVFGATESKRSAGLKDKSLYSGHKTVWSDSGVAAFFGGVHVSSGTTALPVDNLVDHPASVHFIGESKSEISAEDASALLKSKYNVSDAAASKFADLVKASGAKVVGGKDF